MKKEHIKIIKNLLITLAIVYFGYILIAGEVNQRKVTKEFCKQQCTYYPEEKKWGLNMKWFFDENEVESRIPTEKYFGEKELEGCMNYCKDDLNREFKYLTQ